MIGFVLAKRYAQAIIDLALEKDMVGRVGEDLENIAAVYEASSELGFIMSDPTTAIPDKKKIIDSLMDKMGSEELTRKFVHVVLEKNRIVGIGKISGAYRDISDELENRVRTRVVVASPLDKAEEKKIKDALSKLTGKDVILQVEVDEEILGGIVAYVGSRVYDWSLNNQLEQLKESLTSRR